MYDLTHDPDPVLAEWRFTARSANRKTGDVPTAWVGASREQAVASCVAVGCPMAPGARRAGYPACYAHSGTPVMAHASLTRSERAPLAPEDAVRMRAPGARAVRVGAIGDPAAADRPTLARFLSAARSAGLAVLGYTHGWAGMGADLRGALMASCDSLPEADAAIAAGWRAVAVVPPGFTGGTTPAGYPAIVCPAIATGRIDCNQCRLCDAARSVRSNAVICFPDHGPSARPLRAKGAGGRFLPTQTTKEQP